MVKIAICDDDEQDLKRTTAHCLAFAANHVGHELRISTFQDAKSLLSHIDEQDGFDILLMDIYMPTITGIDLATFLRKRNDECEIIFLTSSENHAIEAFSLNATHYLLKPYTQEHFESAMEKALAQLERRKSALFTLKSSLGIHKILFADFLYAETDMHMQNIHMVDGTVLSIRMTSNALHEMLSHDRRFYKCGSTYIINLEKIREVTVRTVVLDTKEHLHLQRRQYKTLIERYTQYSLKGE